MTNLSSVVATALGMLFGLVICLLVFPERYLTPRVFAIAAILLLAALWFGRRRKMHSRLPGDGND